MTDMNSRIHLSLLHPRLFHGLALVEAIIQPDAPPGPNAALPSTLRKDLWPSRATAEASFRSNPFFKTWEPRVLENYLRYGLRDTPTKLYPAPQKKDNSIPSVTLTTTKHQEAWSYLRSNFVDTPDDDTAHLVAAKVDKEGAKRLFHCPDMLITFHNLPYVRPNLLWVFGTTSHLNASAEEQDEKVARSGIGLGGSGGTELGRVEKKTIEGGHMLPFEKVEDCACVLATWLETQIEDFRRIEDFWQRFRSGRSDRDMTTLSKEWMEKIRFSPKTRRDDRFKL